MGYKKRSTSLTVRARDESTETCKIFVGYKLCRLTMEGSRTSEDATELKRKEELDTLEDAKQIHALLKQHLPTNTWDRLRNLIKFKVT